MFNLIKHIKQTFNCRFNRCWICKHAKLVRGYGSDKILVCREPSIFKNHPDNVCWFICHEKGCKLWKYFDEND